MADLSPLLAPRSIAVIGASDRDGNVGGRAVRLLRKFGYPGPIWPVNPQRATVADLPCYPSPRDLPQPADLAILAVPAPAIAGMVEECAAAGIRHGIAWAGGFAETGPDGAELQRMLVEACRRTAFNLLGPNSLGLVNSWQPMTASFGSALSATDRLITGTASIVSQSGGTAAAIQALANQAGFGFRTLISSGNEAVLTMASFIEALADDPGTRVIAAYLEGVRDRDAFLAALDHARAEAKPVVALKGGTTAAGARGALAHTGALAGEERVWLAVAEEKAVVTVQSQQELLDTALYLGSTSLAKLPAGPGVAIVVTGGGSGILAADICARQGLSVPPLAEATRARLRPLAPPIASVANPVDFTPDMLQPKWLEQFPAALDALAADPAIDTVLFQFSTMPRAADEVAAAIVDFRRRTDKAVAISWMLTPQEARGVLLDAGVYALPEITRTAGVIARAWRYRAAMEAPPSPPPPPATAFDWTRHVPDARAGQVVSEHDCHRLLSAAGFAVAPGALATTEEGAATCAGEVGYPVVMKGISPAVTHRAAAGLVALDLRSEVEARDAYRALTTRATAIGAALDGVLVQHLVKGGREFLVSALVDPVFGTMISCGAGGTQTEALDDVAIARAPVDADAALALLRKLRMVRRAKLADGALMPLADYVSRFSRLAAGAPWRRFAFEINPVKQRGEEVVAVDGLLVIEEP